MGFWNVCKIISVILGPVLIILGASLRWAIFPAVVDSTVKSTLELKESNTETWDSWKEPPITPYMKFTFFQVENVEDVRTGGKPSVKEVGPFAYREVRRKENIHSIRDEISYGSYIHYEFDAEASGADGKDPKTEITVINPVMAIVNALIADVQETLGETLCDLVPPFSKLAVNKVCGIIPVGKHSVPLPCEKLPPDLVAMCGMIVDDKGNFNFEYKDGNIMFNLYIPDLPPTPYSLPCMSTLENFELDYEDGVFHIYNIKDGAHTEMGKIECTKLIDGAIWPLVEKTLLNPLKDLVNCPEPTPAPASTTTVAPTTPTSPAPTATPPPVDCYNITDYDKVPKECFCDGLTMTDVPDRMIFTGAHSGVLLALHHVLEHIDLHILSILNIEDLNIATFVDRKLAEMGLDLIDLKHGRFGFFKGPGESNATRTWWKINNGKYEMEFYNKVLEFNGQSKLPEPWWQTFGPTPSAHKSGVPGICHDIIGTDGLAFPPGVSKEEDIWLFNDQLCRSIWLNFTREEDVDGVTTYRFSPSKDVFSMSNPNNYCYCPKVERCAKPMNGTLEDEWDMSDCRDRNLRGIQACTDGMLSLKGCQGAPVIMSTPHFLDGDPILAEAIDGMVSDREKHITFLHLEPTTGLPIQAHKRLQVNVPVLQSKYFDAFSSVKENVFPVVWVDEGADIDEENLDKLKSMLVTPFLLVNIGAGFMIGIGGVLIILAGGLAFFCRGR